MTEKARLIPAASVQKTFGKNGELLIRFFSEIPENMISSFNETEPVFILLDEIPVPFYFESIQPKGSGKAVVCFQNFLSEKFASELVGRELCLEEQMSNDPDVDVSGYVFSAYYSDGKEHKGKVTAFFDYPGNPCIELEFNNGKRSLVPFHPHFIRKIDKKSKYLKLSLPDGI